MIHNITVGLKKKIYLQQELSKNFIIMEEHKFLISGVYLAFGKYKLFPELIYIKQPKIIYHCTIAFKKCNFKGVY